MPAPTDSLRFILGLKLRALRQEHDASLQQVADASGLSISYLSEIEKGKKYPTPGRLMDLAGALGIPYDDLVSLRVGDDLAPLKQVFGSDFVQEFPFELFGLRPQDLFGLVSDEPDRAAALIRTLLEIGRTYDVQVEHFLFAALRSYQQMHGNHFADIEETAQDFRQAQDWEALPPPEASVLRGFLEDDLGYAIDTERLRGHADLGGFRSVFVERKEPTLLVNGDLMDRQRAFLFAREIGHHALGLSGERTATSSWLGGATFEQALNNFKASYFAGALLMDADVFSEKMRTFFARERWDGDAFLGCVEDFRATPEMFYYRLTELAPERFGLHDLYFLRFYSEGGTDPFRLNKVLNPSSAPVPHGLGLDEHYCQRWPSIKLLKRLGRENAAGAAPTQTAVQAQRQHFLNDDTDFFVLSTARPLALQPGTLSCVSIGFLMDDAFHRTVRFADDENVAAADVNLTCERCPLAPAECLDRAAAPVLHERRKRQERQEAALTDLMRAVRGEK
jgi:transcriptional regulator with XRE-family HTH domain